MLPQTLIDRFHSKASKTPNGCVQWTAGKFKDGYGGFWALGKMHRAHRVAWELANGPICDDAMQVLHRCDNPLCVNPSHLFLGTITENMKDRDNKGRNLSGERMSFSKLKIKDVREIRGSTISSTILASQYGVSWSNICHIRRGKTWKGV